ncbi:DUF4037 domain-containing protein [Spirochaeta cellobiosiphila]|uniref:DUF4037 domain-containing protein n=1 Tax=Spirochaeta cellobiosiphila TaxID=504483 RepID=UPI00041A0FC0|nr:DUF4037 domain-containing protein [Spirochaeta cellobiosiphila]
MRSEAQSLAKDIAQTLIGWDSVYVVTLAGLNELDPFDPYFYLALDVYYQGFLPVKDERRRMFPQSGAFESSVGKEKDRFVVDDLPVRIEYKEINTINQLLDEAEIPPYELKSDSTYVLFRLCNAQIIEEKRDWLERARSRVALLNDEFWWHRKRYHITRMENALNDFSAAVLKGDRLFTQLSLSKFLTHGMGSLFAINRQFEPAPRQLDSLGSQLAILPEGYEGRLEALLRKEGDLDPERKREVAELFAKSIISLG